ncbi:MAG: redoxin domain-containing protein [Planctomycetes bacterium]|nr:redoxin domain-containing protein [Planctomycetota bacterium]
MLRELLIRCRGALLLAALAASFGSTVSRAADASDAITRFLAAQREALAAQRWDDARIAAERVLEIDPRQLEALACVATTAEAQGDRDLLVVTLHEIVEHGTRRSDLSAEDRARVAAAKERLLAEDPAATTLAELREELLAEIDKLAKAAAGKQRWHSALSLYEEMARLAPTDERARAGLKRVQSEGGDELARRGVAGADDPLNAVGPEWIARFDAEHATWEKAARKETPNYITITNAGYQVLELTALAMEQMNRFYRIFYGMEEDDPTPRIDVEIYRDRAEYMEKGQPPAEWAGGHFNGRAVVTYDPRGGAGGSMRGLLQTLFHEASHQFVSLTSSGVPSWLNEGLASFFEGAELLSNGRVEWNLVAPGRLMPLVDSLKSDPESLTSIITGQVDDYRIYYPYGWGIVYYLYNCEDAEGNFLYRERLAQYRSTYRGTREHVERFVQFFVTEPKVPEVKSLADFEARWRAWILARHEAYLGRGKAALELVARADALRASKPERAIEMYERALRDAPEALDALWKLATLLDERKLPDRAAGTYRRVLSLAHYLGIEDDPLLEQARERVQALEPAWRAWEKARALFDEDALRLAKRYQDDELPRMALRVVRFFVTEDDPDEAAVLLWRSLQQREALALERWVSLFNEDDTKGWFSERSPRAFRVENGVLIGRVEKKVEEKGPTTGIREAKVFDYSVFFVDRVVRGDFSFEAEVRAPKSCRLFGIAFGSKSDEIFQSAMLLPEGYLDLATRDGDWKLHRRVTSGVQAQSWTKLRVDVRANLVTVWIDDRAVEERRYESAAELRGDLGIVLGEGEAEFRRMRYRETDARLPRLFVRGVHEAEEGELAAAPRPPQRAPAGQKSYRGSAPPALQVSETLNVERAAADLDAALGAPLVLCFFSPESESAVPCLPYLQERRAELERRGFRLLAFSNQAPEVVRGFLAQKKLELPVALEPITGETLKAYALFELGLPRVYLLDIDGRVAWEGTPEWQKGQGSKLDAPIEDLARQRGLDGIAALRESLSAAREDFLAGRYREALATFDRLAAVPGEHPLIAEAKGYVERAERLAEKIASLAASCEKEERVRDARTHLLWGRDELRSTFFEPLLAALEKTRGARSAERFDKALEKALAKAGPKPGAKLREALPATAKPTASEDALLQWLGASTDSRASFERLRELESARCAAERWRALGLEALAEPERARARTLQESLGSDLPAPWRE